VNPSSVARPLEAHQVTLGNRIRRAAWNLVWVSLGRCSPNVAHRWRRLLLRTFGATVGSGAHVYPNARIWAPWNLKLGARSCLANGANCYNVALVEIGDDVVVSQDAYLCTATHDYNLPSFPLRIAPISIESRTWVAAGAFVSPGVTLHAGAVVGARSVVTKNVPPWTVVGGNPARVLKERPPC
jgi:putative colanic acid biosynthesis acetyltransferase WcaF